MKGQNHDVFVIHSGIDGKKIEKCMGDPNADEDNPVLKEEQEAQVILPCLVIYAFMYLFSYLTFLELLIIESCLIEIFSIVGKRI